MTRPAVTVVIPCHSDREWAGLRGVIAAVQAQSVRPEQVVVVVDHNESLLSRARAGLSGVTVVPNTGQRGASGARNTGAAYAGTDLVAFLDGDAAPRAGWLAALVAPLADDRVVGTGGTIVPEWADDRPAWLPDEFLWTVGASYQPSAGDARPVPVRNVWSASMAVRRAAFLEVGGFRDGFGKVGNRSRPEDTDLCLRMDPTGARWRYVPTAVVDHPVPAARSTFGYFLRRCYAEGRGKVSMARLLGGRGTLTMESNWLRNTVRHAARRTVRGGLETRRAGAAVTGLAAAGIGAAVEVLASAELRVAR